MTVYSPPGHFLTRENCFAIDCRERGVEIEMNGLFPEATVVIETSNEVIFLCSLKQSHYRAICGDLRVAIFRQDSVGRSTFQSQITYLNPEILTLAIPDPLNSSTICS